MGLIIEIVAGARSFKIFCGQLELESPSRFSSAETRSTLRKSRARAAYRVGRLGNRLSV